MTKVKLSEIIDAIEFNSDGVESFINIKTSDICCITDDLMSIAEDESDTCPDWQKDEIKIVKAYLENPDDYLALPSQHDVNEYEMMEDFASNQADEKIAGQLLISLRGQGAFRRFKDNVNLLDIEKEWYKFRDEKYKQFALEWCEENDITVED